MSRVGGFSSAAEPLDRKGKSSSASKTYGRRRLSVEGLASGAALESPPQKPQRRGSLGKMYAEEKMEVGMRRTTGRERLTRTGGKERRKSEGAGPKTKVRMFCVGSTARTQGTGHTPPNSFPRWLGPLLSRVASKLHLWNRVRATLSSATAVRIQARSPHHCAPPRTPVINASPNSPPRQSGKARSCRG